MLHALASSGLLEFGDWSCLESIPVNQGLNKTRKYFDNVNVDIITELHSRLPHNLETEPQSNFNNVNGWGDKHAEPSKSSYFYIASETFMSGEYKFFTEKVFKPIAHFQPFLFLSYPGALHELKKLGFKTFHPLIDESYDNEIDEVIRFNLIFKEIKRLCSMTNEELHTWYWGMEDILIHNHNHLKQLYLNEPASTEFVNFLNDQIHR
jgi:hypothetical protein